MALAAHGGVCIALGLFSDSWKETMFLEPSGPQCSLTNAFQPGILLLWGWWSGPLCTDPSLPPSFPSSFPSSIPPSYSLHFPHFLALCFHFLSNNTAGFLWAFYFSNSLTSQWINWIFIANPDAKPVFPLASWNLVPASHTLLFQYWLYYQSPQTCPSYILCHSFSVIHCPYLELWEITEMSPIFSQPFTGIHLHAKHIKLGSLGPYSTSSTVSTDELHKILILIFFVSLITIVFQG